MTTYTLSDAVQDFLGRYQRKPLTQRSYADALRWITRYIGSELDITLVTPLDVVRAIQQYEARPSVGSVYTVNKMIRTWQTFFNWCVNMDVLDKSPARSLMKRPEPNNDVLERTMPEHVYFGLLDFYSNAAGVDPKRYLRMLCLLHVLGSSGRRGGVAALQWSDIDFALREATVTEKGEKTRTLLFSRECVQVLREWQLLQKNTGGNYVFSVKGGTISSNALGKYFREYCHRAGFDKGGDSNTRGWGPQAVRHFVGIDLQDAGVGEIEAAGIMGHAVSTYREYYASQDKKRLKDAADRRHRRTAARRKARIEPFSPSVQDDTGSASSG